MLNMDKCRGDRTPLITLLTLPTELLVYIMSFLTAVRDKARLRYVSQKLRDVSETPSLWREFAWPYYHNGDEGCVNNVLKVCGQHVKRLFFPHHVIPSKLIKMLEHCSNVIELRLPKTDLSHKQLENILLNMARLQKLDVHWDGTIIEILLLVRTGLTELTVRTTLSQPYFFYNMLHYWMSSYMVPKTLNIFHATRYLPYPLMHELWDCWVNYNSISPVGHTGYIKLYCAVLGNPLNLYPIRPDFQLTFCQPAVSPFITVSDMFSHELFGLSDLLLTDCTHGDDIAYKARFRQETNCRRIVDKGRLNCDSTCLKYVTEFIVSFAGFYSEHLEQLAIACPNLQRLNLRFTRKCLNSLQGLRAIASSCRNLQGLDLFNLHIEELENQTQFWKILSDMKLTHLAICLCIVQPSVRNIRKLIALFQKCTSLQALECNCECSARYKRMSVLSYFSSLVHCIITATIVKKNINIEDILTSCKKIKCLVYRHDQKTWKPLSSMTCTNLQQLFIMSTHCSIPDNFMSTISAHGGLVHVVLCVRSVTREGIAVLVRNSPNLLILHAVIDDDKIYDCNNHIVKPEVLTTYLKQEFSHRHLFSAGSYIVTNVRHLHALERERLDSTDFLDLFDLLGLEGEQLDSTDLFSLWYPDPLAR